MSHPHLQLSATSLIVSIIITGTLIALPVAVIIWWW
jgi:hypothetical protein